jgi:hypothetical protein
MIGWRTFSGFFTPHPSTGEAFDRILGSFETEIEGRGAMLERLPIESKDELGDGSMP